ncbi:glycosyltransferase family 4 protein [Spirosoma soli]|uniref:Glycosyltransferase family 4 protein n=1 Tax=Spirosoma soli TaxID=1770529 RepID=A0ABW5MA99_9BACT
MRILYLTFYFEPDLCAGSFRNTALINELARQLNTGDEIHVVTTQPNRYDSFKQTAPEYESRFGTTGCRVTINRIAVPAHTSGLIDQIRSFAAYYRIAHRLTKGKAYNLVVASSSRLFTAFVGARLARRTTAPLFLDIRDLFRETILEMFRHRPMYAQPIRLTLNPVLQAVERYTFGYAKHINLVSEGFQPYFTSFTQASYSYCTNGIDEEFLTSPASTACNELQPEVKTLLYAGNIGEGQGLHKIIPQAARQLGNNYRFIVIGDGGAKAKLEKAIAHEGLTNVEVRNPVARKELLIEYQKTDYLFAHLNDYQAFKRVLPSKLFEYGAMDKPIVAGVAGYAAHFVRQHLGNSLLFDPGDADSLVVQLREMPYTTGIRTDFVLQFQRKTIAEMMVRHMLQTANPV